MKKPPSNNPKVPVTAAIVMLAVLLAGCVASPGSPGPHETKAPGELTVGVSSPPISLDTLRIQGSSQGRWFADPAYSSILDVDADGKVVAGLADKWGYSGGDLTHFSFTLRPELVFSDGTPLNAQAVVNSFKYFASKANSPYLAYFAGMVVSATDDRTVQIVDDQPNPIIDQLLGPDYFAFSPISAAGIAAGGDARGVATFGAGPYVLDAGATVVNDHYTYTPNNKYYDQEGIHFAKITVKVIPNPTQLVQALQSGQIQATMVDPTVSAAVNGANINKIDRPGAWNGLLPFGRDGVAVPALKSKEVRQAIAYALDRKALAKAAYGDLAVATQVPAMPGPALWGHDTSLEGKYNQDLDKARKLLAAGGYPNGFEMNIIYPRASGSQSKLAQGIVSQLKEIGITVTLKPEPSFGAWVNDFFSGDYGMTIFGFTAGPMYLSAQFSWTQKAINNPKHIVVPELESAFANLARSSGAEAGEAAKAVTKVVMEEALSIPIVQEPTIYAFDGSLRGLEFVGDSANATSIVSWSKN